MSEAFRERLRRLRRDGAGSVPAAERGPAPEPRAEPELERDGPGPQPADRSGASGPGGAGGEGPPEGRGIPDWLRARLARRGGAALGLGEGAGEGARAPATEGAADARALAAPSGAPAAPGLPEPLAEARHALGCYAERRVELARVHRHGAWSLDEIAGADSRAFELATGDGALAGLDLTRAVFLDTETTGLSGGAGTIVFLVGLGWFEGTRFVLWQGFLRSPAEERALLAAVAERVGEAGALVSFFGKSFDRHRLEDKMRLHGVAPPFAALPHLDLYHPLRRLYGGATPDGRLCTMESLLCGLERADDLPGSRAPEAWFDFLAGRPHRLEGVFRHNADDVLSLVTLAAHLGRVEHGTRADGSPLSGCALARSAALGRLYHARRAPAGARRWLGRHLELAAIAGRAGEDCARESRYLLAESYRLAREPAAAEGHLLALSAGPPDRWSVRALVSLAKLAEHDRRDPARALSLVRQARALLARTPPAPDHRTLLPDLARRESRLTPRVPPP